MSLAIRVAFIVGLAALPVRVFGQVQTDAPKPKLIGTVVDHSGARIPYAKVTLYQDADIEVRAVTHTDAKGAFQFVIGKDGLFAIVAELEHGCFLPSTVKGIEPRWGDGIDLSPITLQVETRPCNDILEQPSPPVELVPSELPQSLDHPTLEPINTTLCDVVKEPWRFDRKRIQLRTYIASGVDVAAGLYDRRCPPHNLLKVDQSSKILVQSKGYRDLERHLRSSSPIEATVIGVFANNKERDDLNPFDSTFELEAISDVKVRTTTEVFQRADRANPK